MLGIKAKPTDFMTRIYCTAFSRSMVASSTKDCIARRSVLRLCSFVLWCNAWESYYGVENSRRPQQLLITSSLPPSSPSSPTPTVLHCIISSIINQVTTTATTTLPSRIIRGKRDEYERCFGDTWSDFIAY